MAAKRGTVSFESILEYYKSHKEQLQKLGLAVESMIVEGRNHRGVPAYVTKMRVKDLESLYLKTKRKPYSRVEDIGDIIGLRVLCLFEQDIAPTFQYLFEIFSGLWAENGVKRGDYQLNEITLFNWGDDEFENSDFMMRAGRVFAAKDVSYETKSRSAKQDAREMEIYYSVRIDGSKPEQRTIRYRALKKGSGYKSIHFIARHQCYSFEVQLRTLLQDVWGELEHSLAYKHGSVNPYISRNFELFARELQIKDNLMSELRDVRDKDLAFEQIDKKATPSHWLGFDQTILKRVFDSPELVKVYQQYESIGKRYSKGSLSADFILELKAGLQAVRLALSAKTEDIVAMHCLAMEEAFLAYCEGNYSSAKGIYEEQLSRADQIGNSMWAANYRLGELQVHEGNVAKALIAFDSCEAELRSLSVTDVSDRERYCVNTKLAYVYWELGFEYIDIAIEKMATAERYFDAFCKGYPDDPQIPMHQASLLNNLCYYHLEGWQISKEGDDGAKTFRLKEQIQEYCRRLEEHLDRQPRVASSNMFDTLAWYYFNLHLEGRQARQLPKPGVKQSYSDLQKARNFIKKSQSVSSSAISLTKSATLRSRHAEAILVEYDRLRDAGLVQLTTT